jgi:hypothetical protein
MYKFTFITNATMAKFKVEFLMKLLNYFKQDRLLCMLICGGKTYD